MHSCFFIDKDSGQRFTRRSELHIDSLSFYVHKFNHRVKPSKTERIRIVSCLSEFGCEVLIPLYCLPRFIRRHPGSYIIAIGWYGRHYLYKHLVDEFWELKEEHMWLRDFSYAFSHNSNSLEKLERAATKHGIVVPSKALGAYAVANHCRTCGNFWHNWATRSESCPRCKSTLITRSMFSDTKTYVKESKLIPKPKQELLNWAKKSVPENAVGIFARNRKTYGRNLDIKFYLKLIDLLRSKGYQPIWMGEKCNVHPCPKGIPDFSGERDLEKTLAIICNLKFTIQFWTASTRLAGIMGVPFILFESPEQIYVSKSGCMGAQEGKRLELFSFGPKKVVLSHYQSVNEDHDTALFYVDQAINELMSGNCQDIIGMVEDKDFCKILQKEYLEWLT